MRTITVDPVTRTIMESEIDRDTHLIAKRFASRPHVAARFPNGDVLLAAPSEGMPVFTIGGSKPVGGLALVVGPRRSYGERAPARTSLDDVTSMVRWLRTS